MVAALEVGAEVVTNGGILGKVTELGEQYLYGRDRRRRQRQGAAPHRRPGSAERHPEERLTLRGLARMYQIPTWRYWLVGIVFVGGPAARVAQFLRR